MANCLVTGVAGFIGSHLAEALLAKGHRVVGVDCFTDYYAHSSKEANLASLKGLPGFEFEHVDLCTADLAPLVQGAEYVFHEAAQPGVRASWGQDFHIYLRDNVLATQRLLEAIKGNSPRLRRLVYASSSSVYGEADEVPVREGSPTRPHSPYGVTKLAAEHLCALYQRNFDIPTISLRYFTVYGPRQRPDMAFSRFIAAMREAQPLSVFGDGHQTRDFTFVSDAVEANMLAMQRGAEGAVYNVAGGARVSVQAIIQLLEAIMGVKAKITYRPAQHGDVRDTWADTSRAEEELGFRPQISLEEGLRAQVAWLASQ